MTVSLACGGEAQQGAPETRFAAAIERLSEPGGYFDTDNLISNEASYLHVMGPLRKLEVKGGAYIGVGPDQNFSYIAQIRPRVALIVDIRRDNMLLHLMFKALFELAPTRIEYLSLLFGRPPPTDAWQWPGMPIESLIAYVDSVPPHEGSITSARWKVDSAVATFGVLLTPRDSAVMDEFHRAFIDSGMSLRFRSAGRPPRFYYPTYRRLLLERDLEGLQGNFLASADAYGWVRSLQLDDRVIPVVGDLAGHHALRAIADFLRERGDTVSAFYTSNVEFYLFRSGSFDAFASNLRRLPRGSGSMIIRSVFRIGFADYPDRVPGYYSTQLLQSVDRLLRGYERGEFGSYRALVTARTP